MRSAGSEHVIESLVASAEAEAMASDFNQQFQAVRLVSSGSPEFEKRVSVDYAGAGMSRAVGDQYLSQNEGRGAVREADGSARRQSG
jgi:hypothetical protein